MAPHHFFPLPLEQLKEFKNDIYICNGGHYSNDNYDILTILRQIIFLTNKEGKKE